MAGSRTHPAGVLVLGAGLQGSCVALALAAKGHRVTVLDRADRPMAGASRNTEAKIHLGYVYALDRTGVTQRRIVRAGSGYCSQSETMLTFGLGQAQTVESLEVVWPSGQVDGYTNLPVNRLVRVIEGQAGDID